MSRLSPARLAAAGLTTLALVVPSSALASATCPEVDVVVVRGSTEGGLPFDPYTSQYALDGNGGYYSANGVFTRIKNELVNPTDGSTPILEADVRRTDIAYPADLPFPELNTSQDNWVVDSPIFRASAQQGLSELITHLYGVVAACSNTRFVLLGYSQGALVVNNVLTNPRAARKWITNDAELPPVDARVPARIAAAAVFADIGRNIENRAAVHAPTAVSASAPGYLQGSKDDLNRGMNDGPASPVHSAAFPRPVEHLSQYEGRIRSYCLTNDIVCTTNFGVNILPHVQYGEANQPTHRQNLAIFSIQQLRNQADKRLAAQCSFTGATNSLALSQPMSLRLRFRAVVKDRAQINSTNKTDQIKADLEFNANEVALLQFALGSPTALRRSMLSLGLEAKTTTLPGGVQSSQDRPVSLISDQETPLNGGMTVPLPGGSPTTNIPKSVDWNTISTTGYTDLKIGNTFYLAFYGKTTGYAVLTCNLSSHTSTEFGGRHFGRVAIG
ncbi:MAG: cutinase family protein [Solirubrobacteraceae bacterium]|nr:cutinase family protein [Solirubrobacteraceae bacterium]